MEGEDHVLGPGCLSEENHQSIWMHLGLSWMGFGRKLSSIAVKATQNAWGAMDLLQGSEVADVISEIKLVRGRALVVLACLRDIPST